MFRKLGSKLYKWMQTSYNLESGVEGNANDIKYAPSMTLNSPRPKRGTSYSSSSDLNSRGMYFKIIPAAGGIAVEVSQYLPRTDEEKCMLYIIPDEADLGEELAKIITMQSMHQ